jgi:hypothetical protein
LKPCIAGLVKMIILTMPLSLFEARNYFPVSEKFAFSWNSS